MTWHIHADTLSRRSSQAMESARYSIDHPGYFMMVCAFFRHFLIIIIIICPVLPPFAFLGPFRFHRFRIPIPLESFE
jgi:hypothetical protein